jgi:hypothetical protein
MRIVSSAAGLILLSAVTAWAQTPITIFGNAVPQNPVIADSAVTLGIKFYSTQAGTIAGIRFYRGQTNSSRYTVELFSSSGTLLGSARDRDTCSVPCWEQINFASPISIAANTTYVAAYYASNGDYADDTGTSGGLTNGASNGPLIAPASSQVGGNGVYTYSRSFPNQTWQDSNYYVDVSFTPSTPTPTPTLMLSFSPPNPSIPSDAPGGTVVATAVASWSDGSEFTGTYSFAQPYSNDGGVFALNGNQIIVNPNGPGLSEDANKTQNITVVATQ